MIILKHLKIIYARNKKKKIISKILFKIVIKNIIIKIFVLIGVKLKIPVYVINLCVYIY